MHPHVGRRLRPAGGAGDAGPGIGHDLQVHPDLPQIGLEHLRRLHGLVEFPPDRGARGLGRVAMRLRRLQVVGIGRQLVRIAPEVVGVRPGIAHHHPLQDDLVEAFVVEGLGEAQARILVVEGRLAVVHAQREDAHALILGDAGLRVLVDALHLVGRQVAVGGVDLAAQQRQHAGAGFHHRPAADLRDRMGIVGPAAEMPGEAFEVERGARPVGRGVQRVGAGARGIRRQPFGAAVAGLLVRRDDARVDDGDQRHGGEEGRIGHRQHEAHRSRVGGGDVLRLQHRREGGRRRLVHRQQAPEGIDHVGRGHRAAVVEGDPLPQAEFPGQPIFRDRVLLRQPGDELRRVALVAVQPVIDVEQDELARHVEHRMRIERRRQGIAPDQRALLRHGRRDKSRRGDKQGGEQRGAQAHGGDLDPGAPK